MNVLSIWITGNQPRGEYLCSVTVEMQAGPYRFQVSGMRIVQTANRRLLAMPSRKTSGQWQDVFHPCDQKTRDFLEKHVLEYYQNNFERNGRG